MQEKRIREVIEAMQSTATTKSQLIHLELQIWSCSSQGHRGALKSERKFKDAEVRCSLRVNL
jgi:hypothetical protein